MGNRFIIVIGVVVVLFFGLLIFNKQESGAPTTSVNASNNVKGTGSITLVEYGDFECPGCAAFFPTLQQVEEKYKDQLVFQFRNFPLTQIHPNAMAAHRAAEAASKQGKFWEMHDLLYGNQRTWIAQAGVTSEQATRIFEGYAQQIGLNLDQYKTDFPSSAVNDVIQADVKAGQELKVNSTPTFFLNGTQLENPENTVEYFSQQIDALLNNQQQ